MNIMLEQTVNKLMHYNQVPTKTKRYLTSKGLTRTYSSILSKMLSVLNEREENYLKIQLIN